VHQRMRIAVAFGAMMLTGAAWAQSLPGGLTQQQLNAVPPELLKSLPSDILTKIPLGTLMAIPPDLFRNIPPDLLAKIPPNAATMTPDQAIAYYKSLDPAQKQALKDQAKQMKARIEAVPGLMDKLKALVKAYVESR
jgi:hypothetical protein